MPIQRTFRLAALGLCSALAVSLVGCGDPQPTVQPGESGQTSTSAQLEPDAREADPARALERSATRWDHKVAGDWIQVYDYMLPDLRPVQTLGRFLTDKEYHVYENPTKPMLLGTRDKMAFIEVTCLWTPIHPMVLSANNLDDPSSLRQELAVIETWIFSRGEWYWSKEERQNEFFDANPDILPGGASSK